MFKSHSRHPVRIAPTHKAVGHVYFYIAIYVCFVTTFVLYV